MKVKVWPQLYAKTSTGAIKTWQIQVEPFGSYASIRTFYGQLGGKIQEKVEFIKEGKNLGKANATTPYEQALFNAQSDYNKKVDKKYITEIPNGGNEPDHILLPMLAHPFNKRKHNISYPAFGQPKLNGVRCLAKKVSKTEIRFTTRKCKSFPQGVTAHLVQPLLAIMDVDEIFDGEFYNHSWVFQQITETVTKVRKWAKELEFHVFDIAGPGTFEIRNKRLVQAQKANKSESIKFVPCDTINSEQEVKTWHDKYVADGYEGVIVRNTRGEYKFDHRSKDLQKYKEFIDEEFIIVGLGDKQEVITDPQTGKDVVCVVFKCKLNINDDTFDVRPKGTVAHRAALHKNIKKLIGQPLTIRYQELSIDKKPIFPVGLAVRNYE